jgi:2-phosphosulfolactate phosphatase
MVRASDEGWRFLKRLRVLMTRQEIVPERLAGATAVVIDVFMATTTLLTILENGARDVYPVAGLEKADEVGAKLDAAGILRGGEQDAARIEATITVPFRTNTRPRSSGAKT